MRAFGIVMALFGCAIALLGFYLVGEISNSGGITCTPNGSTSTPQTTCYFDSSLDDPNVAARRGNGGVAAAVVGAGFIAGGLACAGAGGNGRKPSTSFAPPVGGAPGYGTGPGQPGPAAYGQQPPPPPQYGSQQ